MSFLYERLDYLLNRFTAAAEVISSFNDFTKDCDLSLTSAVAVFELFSALLVIIVVMISFIDLSDDIF